MNNATELYWNISQLFPSENTSVVATTDNIYLIEGVEPDFIELISRLHRDRVGLLAFLFLFSFATVFGNSLVILAVIRERYLHSKFFYFIFFCYPF